MEKALTPFAQARYGTRQLILCTAGARLTMHKKNKVN
jgi:hypothetical protein